MKTVLAVMQLIRAPLLLTALADASVVAILGRDGLAWEALAPLWAASAGLYVFGMAGNDVLDRRRDAEAMQAGRPGRINPIAAGRLSPAMGAAVAALAMVLALAVATASPAVNAWATLAGVAAAAVYNVAGKHWPPVGLVLLGAARAANAAQGAVDAQTGMFWAVPTVLGFHVVFVSAFAYAWERKRPPLYGNNWFYLLVACAAVFAGLGLLRSRLGVQYWPAGQSLAPVAGAWLAFLGLFLVIFFKVARPQRGPMLIMTGLSWLIVLDWAFCFAGGLTQPGILFAALLVGVYALRRLQRQLTTVAAPAPGPSARPRRRKRRR